ncbi:MAG TPA: hypothetical protein PKA05_01660 [Roseiflexaceae bacterium]|nr:hypothetical protein [Roseiflexaceae bacterium]HMP39063.1 hypothetical protein [Roseiflexaceae bacterium]
MGSRRFDWRWVALIVLLVVLVNRANLPWQLVVVAVAAGGGYLLREGWRIWRLYGGQPARTRVQYWRGQRYESGPARPGPALPDWSGLKPAVLHLIFGMILLLIALALLLQSLGL